MSGTRTRERWLVVRIDDDLFALEADTVRAVLSPRAPAPLPFVKPCIPGIVLFHGGILPVVDPRLLLRRPGEPRGESRPIVVVGARGGIGLLVNEVLGMTGEGSSGEVPDEIHRSAPVSPDQGIHWEGKLAAVLHVEPLLPADFLLDPEVLQLKARMARAEGKGESDAALLVSASSPERQERTSR